MERTHLSTIARLNSSHIDQSLRQEMGPKQLGVVMEVLSNQDRQQGASAPAAIGLTTPARRRPAPMGEILADYPAATAAMAAMQQRQGQRPSTARPQPSPSMMSSANGPLRYRPASAGPWGAHAPTASSHPGHARMSVDGVVVPQTMGLLLLQMPGPADQPLHFSRPTLRIPGVSALSKARSPVKMAARPASAAPWAGGERQSPAANSRERPMSSSVASRNEGVNAASMSWSVEPPVSARQRALDYSVALREFLEQSRPTSSSKKKQVEEVKELPAGWAASAPHHAVVHAVAQLNLNRPGWAPSKTSPRSPTSSAAALAQQQKKVTEVRPSSGMRSINELADGMKISTASLAGRPVSGGARTPKETATPQFLMEP